MKKRKAGPLLKGSFRQPISLICGVFLLMMGHIPMFSQQVVNLRSAFCLGGFSAGITANNHAYHVQQSVGQPGAIGTFTTEGFVLRQGFIQPLNGYGYVKSDINLQVSVYPNPFTSHITICLPDKTPRNMTIKLYDLIGRPLLVQEYEDSQEVTLNLEALAPGHYILSIRTSDKQFVSGIIKAGTL